MKVKILTLLCGLSLARICDYATELEVAVTPCKKHGSVKTVLSYFPTDLNCENTAPQPYEIPCEQVCLSGTALAFKGQNEPPICHQCPANTYSCGSNTILVNGEIDTFETAARHLMFSCSEQNQ